MALEAARRDRIHSGPLMTYHFAATNGGVFDLAVSADSAPAASG